MKKYVYEHNGWKSTKGSGKTANKKQGIIRVGGHNSIDLNNGASLELDSANVAVDTHTGDILVNINFSVRMYMPDHTIVATCENCTPDEFKEVYDDLIPLSNDAAYDYILNVLYGNIY